MPRRIGLVKFQVFGQQCGSKKCSLNNRRKKERGNNNDVIFEPPTWYSEEITKVLQNLFNQIRNKIYKGPITQRMESQRTGNPKGTHNPKLCQACRNGSPCKFTTNENRNNNINSEFSSSLSSGYGSSRKQSTAIF